MARPKGMLDHVIIDVEDLPASRGFYEQALLPLGCSVLMEVGERCAFGSDNGRRQFRLAARGGPATTGVHLAFTAETRAAVDAFHRAALASGAIDNGRPGLRSRYHASYYGGFVLDLHANNVEAVHYGGNFDA